MDEGGARHKAGRGHRMQGKTRLEVLGKTGSDCGRVIKKPNEHCLGRFDEKP
jgi:hypothetical protein